MVAMTIAPNEIWPIDPALGSNVELKPTSQPSGFEPVTKVMCHRCVVLQR
jgi:hypothetical protein